MCYNIVKYQKILEKSLKPKRYIHSIGVMYTAQNLAMRYNISLEKAGIAGILHDCAKEMDEDELFKFCKKKDIEITNDEIMSPSLLHSKVGAYIAKEKYEITDDDIINAIRYHTTGHADMSMLEKIIYIADYIEPNRKIIPGLDEVRKIVYIDIDKACRIVLENTINYLKESRKHIDNNSIDAYNYYTRS
ncbi:MAG: HD domain-containing protein [Lachnospiraceae bacterium]|nr:HD domain-containing protein [Lachnospiraceae bacterium]